MRRKIFSPTGLLTLVLLLGTSTASAIAINLNPATPLGGYDLGGGTYATLIGVHSFDNSSSLGGTSLTAADLFAEVISGTVTGFYYAAGNGVSSTFDNIVLYAPFVSDSLSIGSNPSYNRAAFDSLYAIHTTTTVVFEGTNTIGVGSGQYITGENPFASSQDVPEPSALALLSLGLLCFGLNKKRLNRK